MKRKLLNLVFVIVACVNTVVFYSFTSSTQDACASTSEVTSQITVYFPYSFPTSPNNYLTCGNGSFDWQQLTVPNGWYAVTAVFYGSGNTLLHNYSYGNFDYPGVSSIEYGVRKYYVSQCTDLGHYPIGSDCATFPVNFMKGAVNKITVYIVSPESYYVSGKRSVMRADHEFSSSVNFTASTYAIYGGQVFHTYPNDPC